MYVGPVNLEILDSALAQYNARARAQRLVLTKEQVTVENIGRVATLFLLRLRPKNVRATYKRYWECIKNLRPR